MSIVVGQGEGGSRTVLDYLPAVFPLETALPCALLLRWADPSPASTLLIITAFASMTPLLLWLHGLQVQQAPLLAQYLARTAVFVGWALASIDSLRERLAIPSWMTDGGAVVAGVLAMALLQRRQRQQRVEGGQSGSSRTTTTEESERNIQ